MILRVEKYCIIIYRVAKKTSLILNFNHFRCPEGIEMKFGLLKEKDVFSKC